MSFEDDYEDEYEEEELWEEEETQNNGAIEEEPVENKNKTVTFNEDTIDKK